MNDIWYFSVVHTDIVKAAEYLEWIKDGGMWKSLEQHHSYKPTQSHIAGSQHCSGLYRFNQRFKCLSSDCNNLCWTCRGQCSTSFLPCVISALLPFPNSRSEVGRCFCSLQSENKMNQKRKSLWIRPRPRRSMAEGRPIVMSSMNDECTMQSRTHTRLFLPEEVAVCKREHTPEGPCDEPGLLHFNI